MESWTLHDMFAKASSDHSEQTAVTFDDGAGKPTSLLYKHLRSLSDELCSILREKCHPHKGVIGLYCRENLLLPVWILGIMQTPAAYAPLDPAAPGLLSSRVMEGCGLLYCAVQTELLEKFQKSLGEILITAVYLVLPKFKLTLVKVKSLHEAEQDKQTEQLEPQTMDGTIEHKDSFAYVLHTSGTTGIPKIVKVPHKCIRPNISDLSLLFQVRKEDVVFLASPLTFDPSVVEMFMALTSGAELLIVPALLKKLPKRLSQMLFKSHKTTVLQATPSLLCRFGPHILKEEVLSAGSSLRVLLLGGEPCPAPQHLAHWKHKDNQTEMYNLYGVTEVSCWASCYRITETDLHSHPTSPVPLGVPLSHTEVEVRDEHGAVIHEGDGQVFIGGQHRVCLLDREETLPSAAMRATGDWVRLKDKQMYFLGRRDRMIKRHGQRLSLDEVQQLILNSALVSACTVALHENRRLVAFIVTCKSEDTRASPVVVCDAGEEPEGGVGGVCGTILKELSQTLAHFSVPDTVVVVPEMPLTAHGKVDIKALLKVYQTHRSGLLSSSTRNFTKETLESLWKNSLNLPKDASINEKSTFLLSGGDSLKALVFHDDLVAVTGLTSPHLLQIILEGTFSDVLQHISEAKPENTEPEATKRHPGKSRERMAKRARTRRGRDAFEVMNGRSRVLEARGGSQSTADVTRDEHSEGKASLSRRWASDTGRCVDASPALLLQRGGRSTVFIGSHSHRLQALDLRAGSLVWERVLGGRIQASAAVSPCGTLVIVGCYDGGVYFLNVSSGETDWVFQTGDAVKCRPAVDAESGLVLVGSHDGHVYALDPKTRHCVWKHGCGGGALFSSPFMHPSLRRLFVATLGGRLLCLNVDTAEESWSFSNDVPFFSSPVCSETHVVIGSADGNVYGFSLQGELRWRFGTQAPVFSSPCLTPDGRRVLCGSHDAHVYCVSVGDGALAWRFQTSGRVYSSPRVFQASAPGTRRPLVALASTDGTLWVLDVETGLKRASHTLPGELFSSPLVHDDSLVIGCRDDYVYCLKLEFT